jgi:hypothetical protein
MDKEKEEGWNQVKWSKISHKTPKSGAPNGKGPQSASAQQSPSLNGQANKFGPLSSAPEETQEVEKQKTSSPDKGAP